MRNIRKKAAREGAVGARREAEVMLAVLFGLLLLLSACPVFAQTMSAEQMLSEMETTLFPSSFTMRATMFTHYPDRRDSNMTIESSHKADVGTLIEIIEPARSRGTKFLQKSGSLWLYNPKSNSRRAIRLSPRDSFQGSIFANNDLGDTTYADDYEASFAPDETIETPDLGKVECYVIEATARHPEAAYGRIRVWLRKSDHMPLRMAYYAKSGLLFKRMTLTALEQLAGKLRPSKMRMESMEQEGAYTLVTIESMEVADSLPDRMFTQAYLTR